VGDEAVASKDCERAKAREDDSEEEEDDKEDDEAADAGDPARTAAP
jgi:hypothetical protein